jgi:hypothetical protein
MSISILPPTFLLFLFPRKEIARREVHRNWAKGRMVLRQKAL